MPQLLGIPRSAWRGRRDELVTDAPAAIAPFHQVNEAGLIAGVGIVFAGEQVAVFVERQLLWIAQARGKNFQLRAIGVTAQHRAAIRQIEELAILLDAQATVADRK